MIGISCIRHRCWSTSKVHQNEIETAIAGAVKIIPCHFCTLNSIVLTLGTIIYHSLSRKVNIISTSKGRCGCVEDNTEQFSYIQSHRLESYHEYCSWIVDRQIWVNLWQPISNVSYEVVKDNIHNHFCTSNTTNLMKSVRENQLLWGFALFVHLILQTAIGLNILIVFIKEVHNNQFQRGIRRLKGNILPFWYIISNRIGI